VLASPVGRCAEAHQLVFDLRGVLVLPLPDLLDESLAADVEAGDALRGELALHDHLRGDAGVVGARNPERVEARHPLPAGDDIDERVDQGVPDVQPAGDVRRRDDDGELRALPIEDRGEVAAFFPALVDALFEVLRFVPFLEFFFHSGKGRPLYVGGCRAVVGGRLAG
jgi:hypothetical protein